MFNRKNRDQFYLFATYQLESPARSLSSLLRVLYWERLAINLNKRKQKLNKQEEDLRSQVKTLFYSFVTLINYILHKDHEKKNHIVSNTFEYPFFACLLSYFYLCLDAFAYHRSKCSIVYCLLFTIINLCLYRYILVQHTCFFVCQEFLYLKGITQISLQLISLSSRN